MSGTPPQVGSKVRIGKGNVDYTVHEIDLSRPAEHNALIAKTANGKCRGWIALTALVARS